MTRALLFLATFGFALHAQAQPLELPRHSAVPGGIAVIPIAFESRPTATYNGKRVLIAGAPGQWQAVVGIPLDAPPGEHIVTVTGATATKLNIPFYVTDKAYEEQRLKIKNKRMVEPSASDLKRIEKEAMIINTALGRFTETLETGFRFIPPVQGPLSSRFGLKRFFNDQPRKPHSGLDLAAATGANIVAPAAAIVAAVGNYFFNGNNVVLDHGQGLTSMYSHLNRVMVKEGQRVEQGTRIGTVGATGRVTGPHLHWTVSLNDTRVDPELLFDPATLDALSRPTTDQDFPADVTP